MKIIIHIFCLKCMGKNREIFLVSLQMYLVTSPGNYIAHTVFSKFIWNIPFNRKVCKHISSRKIREYHSSQLRICYTYNMKRIFWRWQFTEKFPPCKTLKLLLLWFYWQGRKKSVLVANLFNHLNSKSALFISFFQKIIFYHSFFYIIMLDIIKTWNFYFLLDMW